ncbi:hypothetical protein EXT46_08050 [Pseudoalteromonas sp. CO325X]|uniref:hypothetical protein n=1 Tax=unclassified Pseudoalteromonas TaxID=194690 RepID=UPI0010231BA6|nr:MULTISPECIES: hypothetical protein [unclassified Pseudoalteromonas]MCG7569293.1 hypothetical protein [Pseudoalteromonas sp. CNC9-20]RZF83380.1 hypothetical protein EXT46_08050 [Pseudoalteromonas sp. CO325X]
MIEIVIVIFVGFILIKAVRHSRKVNKDFSQLDKPQKDELVELVNSNPKRYFLSGGSFTKLPKPLAVVGNILAICVILFFVVLFIAALS